MLASLINHPYRNLPVELEFNVTAGTRIDQGDAVWWNGTTLKSVGISASNLVATWSSKTQARRLANARFAGIAEFQTNTTDLFDKKYKLSSGKIFDVGCSSATYKAGDLIGFAKNGSSNFLEAQTFEKVVHPYDAVGIVVENYSAATTRVRALIYTAWDLHFSLNSLVRQRQVYIGAAQYNAGGNYMMDWQPQQRIKILALEAQIEVQTAAVGTITASSNLAGAGYAALDEGLVIPDASAQGTTVRTEQVGTTNPSRMILDHNDTFKAVGDSTPTAGAINFVVEYMPWPYQ